MAQNHPKNAPTHDELDDLMLSCRYGDMEDVQAFVERFGWDPVAEVRDESGNTVLHMICGNGHLDLLNYILPHIPVSLLEVENTSGRSTPLHWAAINAHLSIAQAIVLHPGGLGPLLINAHNAAGMSPLGEAELAGADDVAKWLVEVMNIEQGEMVEGNAAEEDTQDSGVTTKEPEASKSLAEGAHVTHAQDTQSLSAQAEKLSLVEDS